MVRAVYFYNSSKHLTKQGSLEYDSGTGKYAYSSTAAAINQGDVGVTQIVVALPSGTFSGGMPLITFRTPKGYTSNALAMSTASWTIIEDSVETTYQVFYITMTINAWTYTAGRCGIMPGYLQSATFNALDLAFYTVADGVNNYEELDGDTYEQIYEALYSVFSDLAERVVALETLSSANEENIAGMLNGTTEFTQILFPDGVMLRYNSTQTVLEQVLPDGTVGQINKEVWAGVRNEDSVLLSNGYVGAINGVVGEQMSAIRADIEDDIIANKTLGVVTMDDGIAVNAVGKLTLIGEVNDVPIANLINTGTTYAEGQFLWVGLGGKLTNVQPSKPNYQIICAVVLKVYGTTLNMFVMPRIMQKLGDLSNVVITSVANKEMLTYDSATSTWINRTIAEMDLPTLSGNNNFIGFTKFDKNVDMNYNKITNLKPGTVGTDGANLDNIDSKVGTHNSSVTAHSYIQGLIETLQLDVQRLDGRGVSYGEVDYTTAELQAMTDSDRDSEIESYIQSQSWGVGYSPTSGDLIYDTGVGSGVDYHEWEYNGTHWVDNGAINQPQATNTIFGNVKGDGTYISIVAGLVQVLLSDYATRVGASGSSYSYAEIYNALSTRYTKTEVDALLDSIKLIQGVEETSIGSLSDTDTIALSTLTQYDYIIAESVILDGERYSGTMIFKAGDILSSLNDEINFYHDGNYTSRLISSGTNIVYSVGPYGGTGTCILKGIKFIDTTTENTQLTSPSTESVSGTATTQKEANEEFVSEIADIKDGTVHDEMRSVGEETITYRDDGKVSQVVADTVTTTPTYDEYGNITKITEVYALDGKTYETTFTYDKFGRISATNKGEV